MIARPVSDAGEGPAVAYIPGLDGTGLLLHSTGDELAQHARLVCFEYIEDQALPGGAAIYDRLADTIAASLRDRGVQRVTVVAESFGGGVALTLALRHPKLVHALLLVNSFCWFPRRVRIRFAAPFARATPRFLLERGRALMATRLFYRPRRNEASERRFHTTLAGFARPGYARRLTAIRHLDLRDRLKDITVPVELYASTNDRVLPSLRTMQTIANGIPHARLHRIEHANHIVLPLPEERWVDRILALA